jgi:hypothetical protein
MKVAVSKIGRGDPATIPDRLAFHLIAARYGTTPAAVREWPADDYLDARAFLAATGQ